MESKLEPKPKSGLSHEQKQELWRRCTGRVTAFPELKLSVDWTRVDAPPDLAARHAALLVNAFAEMAALEAGAIANADEERMVGHYWLRAPELAPTPEITKAVRDCVASIKQFADEVHRGEKQGAGGRFRHLLVIGIGGSALGPQFVDAALGDRSGLPPDQLLKLHFFDNTDPDGIDRVLASLEGQLGGTLAVVISKSGGTKETANGMKEAKAAWKRAGLDFAKHVVAVTGAGSDLDKRAEQEGWLERFPMWDWVGGRTSETAAVGLLPAALQGVDIDALLAGAAACDEATRQDDFARNPAAQLALLWHHLGDGRGRKDMVVIPYKDRLALFSRYLQQLVMESLGKELNRDGEVVHQGLAVYGNKGSTDQHAYVQQLREGLANFFAVFIEVLKDREGPSIEVDPGITSGDYLEGFLLGTRDALYEKGRESITLTIEEVTPFTVGVLIALFERAVGFYASMINLNAYHQPGVQAGKLAADEVLALQTKVVGVLAKDKERGWSPDELAAELGKPCEAERIFKICEHLSRNPGRGVKRVKAGRPAESRYTADEVAPAA